MTGPDGGSDSGIDRRAFLASLGGAAASLALAGAALPACEPGRAVAGVRPLGLQLYTVRSLMAEDVPGTLEAVAAAGYEEVEFAGYFGQSAEQIRQLLADSGLAAPSAHTALESLEGDALPRTLDAARTAGHGWLVIGWIPPEQRTSLDDYRRVAARLEEAGAHVADAGLRLAYHNHEFEFETLEGAVPYDLIAATDPDLVALQLDLYWIRRGGADAVEYFQAHPGRFPSVHVKDMAPDGGMTPVGAGVIDWPALFAHADTAGIEHYFVEHDNPEDPLASIRASARYLEGLEV